MNIDIKEIPVPEMLEIVQQMSHAHWEEVPFGDYKLTLDLDTDQYIHLYHAGFCRAIGAFIDGQLVGYMSLLAAPMMQHTGVYQLTTDSFYVDPACRKLGIFGMMLTFVDDMCRENGIPFMSMGVNPKFGDSGEIEKFLKNEGFSVTEITYTREVG